MGKMWCTVPKLQLTIARLLFYGLQRHSSTVTWILNTLVANPADNQRCFVSRLFLLSHGMIQQDLSWELDDNLFQWLSTQHHYLPLQFDITSFETALNYIYLLKGAINVRTGFPEDGELARESFFFSKEGRERQHSWARWWWEGKGEAGLVMWDQKLARYKLI